MEQGMVNFDEVRSFVDKLGDLHDARVIALDLDVPESRLVVKFGDIYSNFLGMAAYPGKFDAEVEFVGISSFKSSMRMNDTCLRISEVNVSGSGKYPGFSIIFEGGDEMAFEFQKAFLPELLI